MLLKEYRLHFLEFPKLLGGLFPVGSSKVLNYINFYLHMHIESINLWEGLLFKTLN